jgi:hypothetical protein
MYAKKPLKNSPPLSFPRPSLSFPFRRESEITDHGDHVYTVELAPERPLPSFKFGQCVSRFRKMGKTIADLI